VPCWRGNAWNDRARALRLLHSTPAPQHPRTTQQHLAEDIAPELLAGRDFVRAIRIDIEDGQPGVRQEGTALGLAGLGPSRGDRGVELL